MEQVIDMFNTLYACRNPGSGATAKVFTVEWSTLYHRHLLAAISKVLESRYTTACLKCSTRRRHTIFALVRA